MTGEAGDLETTLRLDAVLDLRAAAPLRDALIEARGAPLCVDASRVEMLGGLCLQVLLAARHAWMRDGASFTITPRSAGFDAAITAFGASGALGMAELAE
jgi:chemotaxis protein CheX